MKYIGFILVLIVSCSKKETIKTGDVIFREVVSTSELSQAINEVTQTQKVTNYTHMGICFIENDSVKVIHSDADLGVVIQSLNTFLKPFFGGQTARHGTRAVSPRNRCAKQSRKPCWLESSHAL